MVTPFRVAAAPPPQPGGAIAPVPRATTVAAATSRGYSFFGIDGVRDRWRRRSPGHCAIPAICALPVQTIAEMRGRLPLNSPRQRVALPRRPGVNPVTDRALVKAPAAFLGLLVLRVEALADRFSCAKAGAAAGVKDGAAARRFHPLRRALRGWTPPLPYVSL